MKSNNNTSGTVKKGYTVGEYSRPEITKTDQLTNEDIAKLLEDYVLTDISNIHLGCHVRYFTRSSENENFRFCYGGTLHRNDQQDKYVMLSNGNSKPWSVQTGDGNAKFYKKMSQQEIKDTYNNIIDELNKKVKELKQENKLLKDELDASQRERVKTKKLIAKK